MPRSKKATTSFQKQYTADPVQKNMNYRLHLKGDWKELKDKLRNKYQFLTDSDFDETENQERLLSGISKKLNKTRQELIWLLNSL
jgi:hypothetical protein